MSGKKIGLLFSRPRSQQRLFWIADPFATKLDLIVHYHKQEWLTKKVDCCVKGQGHSTISKCQWIIVQTTSFESLNLLQTHLAWWCIIMSQIVFQKDLLAVFKVKVTVKDRIVKILLSNVSFWTASPFANRLGLMAHHHKLDCLVKRLDFSVVVKVNVKGKVQNSSESLSGRYLLNCWTFCNQTWNGDASSWSRVLCKKIGLLSSR